MSSKQEQERQAEEAARAAQKAAQESRAYHDVGPGTTPEGRALLEGTPWPEGTRPSVTPSSPDEFERKWRGSVVKPPEPEVKNVPSTPDKPGGQVATVNGKKVYIEGSTMRNVYGFETVEQYRKAQLKGYKPDTRAFYGPLLEEPKFVGTKKEYEEYKRDYNRLARKIGEEKARAELQERQIDIQSQRYIRALKELEPYRVGENSYNLDKAIADKVPESYLKTIFTENDIKQAKQQKQEFVTKRTKKEDISIPKSIWHMITPWAEEKGETFLAYMKGAPARYIENWKATTKEINQEEAKAKYEEEHNRPMWQTLLFGYTIAKDPKTGKYGRIVEGEAPLITPGGGATKLAKQAVDIPTKKLVATMTPKDYGINETTFEVLMKMRLGKLKPFENLPVKPTIKQVKEEISLIQKVETAVKEGHKFSPEEVARIQKESKLLEAIKVSYKKYLSELGKLANKGDKDAIATLKTLGKLKAATTAEARAFTIPGKLTYSRMDELLKEWSSQKPSEALKNMTNTGGLLPAIAIRPEVVSRALSQADNKTKAAAYAAMGEATSQEMKEGNLTEAQTEAIAKLQAQTETKAKVMPKAEIRSQVEAQVKPTTSVKPSIAPRLLTRTGLPEPTPYKPVPVKPAPRPEEKLPEKKLKPKKKKIILPTGDITEEEIRKLAKKTPGTVARSMGKLGKPLKTVWWIHFPDGKTKVVIGKKPEGVRILAEGRGSASKTTQVIKGTLRRTITQKHGAVTATIRPAPTPKGARISFTPLKSVKRGKIYYTKSGNATLMSRRPIGRRRK